MMQGALAAELNNLRTARSPTAALPESQLWEKISTSILKIANQLFEWGKRINSLIEPDKQTAIDAAESLSELDGELVKLDSWLASQQAQRWETLRQGLKIARRDHWNTDIKAAFAAYIELLMRNNMSLDDNMPRTPYHKQRTIAGESLMAYGDALEQAVQIAQLQSW